MAVVANLKVDFDILEDIALGFELAANPTIKHVLSTAKTKLNATSTPPVTKAWSDQRALTAGADSLDLSALPGPNVALNQNFTGLKVQVIAIQALPGNAGPISFEADDTNGYALGGAGGVIVVQPGATIYHILKDNLADVGGSAKAVAVTGTATDGYKIVLAAG